MTIFGSIPSSKLFFLGPLKKCILHTKFHTLQLVFMSQLNKPVCKFAIKIW